MLTIKPCVVSDCRRNHSSMLFLHWQAHRSFVDPS